MREFEDGDSKREVAAKHKLWKMATSNWRRTLDITFPTANPREKVYVDCRPQLNSTMDTGLRILARFCDRTSTEMDGFLGLSVKLNAIA